MTARWFSTVSLIAALFLGYTFFITGNQTTSIAIANAEIADYILKDAAIVETDSNGATRVRYTAANATQNATTGATTLETLRVDFRAPTNASDKPTRWTLTANTGYLAPKSDVMQLSGDVAGRSMDATPRLALATQSLDINITKQSGVTRDTTQIDVGDHTIISRGLFVDMPHQNMRLPNDVRIRLATTDFKPQSESHEKLQLPEIFESDSGELFPDGRVQLKNVRSKSEPFIRADELIATNTDLINNRFTLRGSVRIDLPQRSNLKADAVIVTVRNNRVVLATATGNSSQPVTFEHLLKQADETDNVARGQAQAIDYDVLAGTLLFKASVEFSRRNYEWAGEELLYNLQNGSAKISTRSTSIIHHDNSPASKP